MVLGHGLEICQIVTSEAPGYKQNAVMEIIVICSSSYISITPALLGIKGSPMQN